MKLFGGRRNGITCKLLPSTSSPSLIRSPAAIFLPLSQLPFLSLHDISHSFPPSADKFVHPRAPIQNDQDCSGPCHPYERCSPVCIHTNIIAVLIDGFADVIDDCCGYSGSEEQRKERKLGRSVSRRRMRRLVGEIIYRCNHHINHSAQPSSSVQAKDSTQQSNPNGRSTNAVDDKHNFARQFNGSNGILDGARPLQVGKIDTWLELALDDTCGVEVEHGSLIRAACNIFADGNGQVLYRRRSVVSLAIVENVGGIEVFNVELFSDVADDFVDVALDARFNTIKDLGR